MKSKEIITYIGTILTNILLSWIFTLILFFDRKENFIFVACTTISLSLLIVYIIAQKMNYKLDIFAYNIEDVKFLILNSIFIGDLISIPLSVFISSAF